MLSKAIHFGLRATKAVLRRIGTRLATRLHCATLGALGSGSVMQAGVSFAPPGNVRIGSGCYFWRGVHASSEEQTGVLEIANRVQINLDVHLDFTGDLRIAEDVLISEGAVLYTHDHGLDPRSKPAVLPKTVDRDARSDPAAVPAYRGQCCGRRGRNCGW